MKYVSGDVYEGDFRDGVQHGNGKYRSSNGNEYVGQFQEHQFAG